ncbi:hypothetical protein AB0E69_15155 [Kribbella sp. NPDC026611]|uniref:hypothetical protein n=1 Tax=Kribbella sp. NPDC026611 TaxID=3154911 RepID=UPI00340AA14F
MRPPSHRRPVFLDSTGRRRRMFRRTGVVLAVPAVGYVLLTASSLFGGPRLDTPLIPLPEAANHQPRPRTTPEPAVAQTVESTETPAGRTEPTDGPTQDPSSTDSPTSSSPTPVTTTTTTGTPMPTTVPSTPVVPTTAVPSQPPTTTPAPTTTTHGNKPSIPPGHTKTPGKP